MRNIVKVYNFLLSKFEPVTARDIANQADLKIPTVRVCLHSLSEKENVDLDIGKIKSGSFEKGPFTYLLKSRDPVSVVFEKSNAEMILDVLSKHKKPLNRNQIADYLGGVLEPRQITNGIGEIIRNEPGLLIKSKKGAFVTYEKRSSEAVKREKKRNRPIMNAVDLLFAGDVSRAIKHDNHNLRA